MNATTVLHGGRQVKMTAPSGTFTWLVHLEDDGSLNVSIDGPRLTSGLVVAPVATNAVRVQPDRYGES
jgi:hypothetical protein